MPKKLSPIILTILLMIPILVSAGKHKQQNDAWLGIYTQTVNEDLKEAFDLDTDYGVIVKDVIPDSPADKAGLRQGDVILKFADKKVKDADDLVEFISEHKDGDEVELVLIREGERKTLIAELDNREDDDSYSGALDNYDKSFQWFDKGSPKTYTWHHQSDDYKYSNTYIGISLQNLNSQLGEYFGVKDGEGVLITEVMADSPAESAGLKAGDVIIEINGDEVEEPDDVQEAVGETDEGDEMELTVLRNKNEKTFKLEVAEAPENFYSLPHIMTPDFDDDFLFLPRTKGLFHGNFDHDIFDSEDMEGWRQELEKELKDLRKELKEIKEKLE
jgi:S1-C subfamily serine protease